MRESPSAEAAAQSFRSPFRDTVDQSRSAAEQSNKPAQAPERTFMPSHTLAEVGIEQQRQRDHDAEMLRWGYNKR